MLCPHGRLASLHCHKCQGCLCLVSPDCKVHVSKPYLSKNVILGLREILPEIEKHLDDNLAYSPLARTALTYLQKLCAWYELSESE